MFSYLTQNKDKFISLDEIVLKPTEELINKRYKYARRGNKVTKKTTK